MAYIFSPPTVAVRPYAKRASQPHARFWSHFRPADAGINIWLLDDDTLTTVEPYADEGVQRIFHGGHLHTVSEAERALLIAAGYEVSTVADEASPVALQGGNYSFHPVAASTPNDFETAGFEAADFT